MTALEIGANAATTVSILLAGRNSVHTWWTGIVGAVLFALLFRSTQLYADATLQVFFVATSVIGWRQWLRGDGGRPLPISRSRPAHIGWSVLAAILVAVGYGTLLHRFTDAFAPFLDSAVLVLSVVAQLLLMRRKVETWPFWLAVNTLAVPLFASRGLYLTAVLYSVYWVNALVAWRAWRRGLAA